MFLKSFKYFVYRFFPDLRVDKLFFKIFSDHIEANNDSMATRK